jgi:2-methylcitrate dehydratase PrpD
MADKPSQTLQAGKRTLAQLAASRLKQISAGDFSAEVKAKASLCLIDILGATQSGLLTPLAHSVLRYADLHAGKPEAYIFGSDKAVCAETAAFVNAVLAHRYVFLSGNSSTP